MSIGGKGDPPLNPLHVLSNLLIPCRLPSPPSPWNVLDTAQRIGGLAPTGPQSLVRAIRGTTPSRSSRRGRHASWRDFAGTPRTGHPRSEEHTSELQSRLHLVCRLLLEK